MIILDTHILVWWLTGNQELSDKAKSAIESELKDGGLILVSSITTWELAMLVSKGRLSLSMDIDTWIQIASEIEQIEFLPLDNKVAIESTRLPGEFHKDPADRMLVALSRTLSVPLVTADLKILSYKHVKTIG